MLVVSIFINENEYGFWESFHKYISVSNFNLVCLLPIYFRFWPTRSEVKILKCFYFSFINIIYGLLNTIEIQNRLFKTLFYPENIWVLKKEILEITLNFYSKTFRHGMCFRMSYVFVSSILFWFPQCTRYFWRVFRFLFLEHKQYSNVTFVTNVQGCF